MMVILNKHFVKLKLMMVRHCNLFVIFQTPLHIAVQTEQVQPVHILLYHGANPNLKDRNGNTPTHLAAQLKSVGCLGALLETKSYTSKYKSHVPDLDSVNYEGIFQNFRLMHHLVH